MTLFVYTLKIIDNEINSFVLVCSAPNEMKIIEEADFYGGDNGEHSDVQKYEDCADLCVANADCLYFTYSQLKSKCFLKDWILIKHYQEKK